MPRVKRGTTHVKKRRKLLSKVKGFKWGRKNLIRLAKTAATKAGARSYFDRKKKKSNFRRLAQIKINAASREQGLSYSVFAGKLKEKNIDLDRKILADLAENNPEIFEKIVEKVK
ncbi:50S ribosomal protein L20 [Candidatus Falkowbacteria bacterium]|jgi:large subunit ribosomal protein L20|nr:50S ribosomal protein L20 [Candidatus Falkowbacteria bacterium]MBT4433423.1 50S ribosomal protein L20 [Candidatus Falkowbacteria bacterium]